MDGAECEGGVVLEDGCAGEGVVWGMVMDEECWGEGVMLEDLIR